MPRIGFRDPDLKFNSTVEVETHSVLVKIDGLPDGFFKSLRRLTFADRHPEAFAVKLGFHTFEPWMVSLNDSRTLEKIREKMRSSGFPFAESIVAQHSFDAITSGNLAEYWETILAPLITNVTLESSTEEAERMRVAIAYCNPVVAGRELHPRAERFITTHWPQIISRVHSAESCPAI